MSKKSRRSAFTLIEVLIVVVIMAVLAATIIPQFSSSTKDAKVSSLKFSMHTLRSQIQMYRVHHLGNYPAITSNDLPQLTTPTNVGGTTGAAGVSFPFGPYIDKVPANPFDGSAKVTAVATAGAKPSAVVGALGGWQYDATTGAIWPNDADSSGQSESE